MEDESIVGFVEGSEAILVSEAIDVLQEASSSKLDKATEECLEEPEFVLGEVGIPAEFAMVND